MNTSEIQGGSTAQRRRRRMIRKLLMALIAAVALLAMPATVGADPLWGVDEDDGQLFSINLDNFAVTDYGNLMFDDGGTLADIGEHIEAFTINAATDTAFFAVNADVGGFGEPVLMSFDLNSIRTAGPNVANIVGMIDIGFDHDGDNITGLGFSPNDGLLYALFRDDWTREVDSLLVIDPNTGQVTDNRGEIANSSLNEAATSAEDMVFDNLGNLYVTDAKDNHLYQVDPLTGAILAVIDADQNGGLNGPLKLEALAFDPLNSFLLAADDEQDRLVLVSLADGGNQVLADLGGLSLSDVEGFAWNPAGVPEPASLVLAVLGVMMIAGRRPRRHAEITAWPCIIRCRCLC